MSPRASAVALAAVLIAGILAAWSPGVWAVSLVECGILLAALAARWHSIQLPPAIVAMALWAPLQLATGSTIYRFPTWNAVLLWGANALCFTLALNIFASARARELFLSILLAFGCSLAVIAVLQHYSAPGQALWMFQMPAATFGPFVYKNQFAAFLELLIPIALYRLMAGGGRTMLYAACACSMAAAAAACASRIGVGLIALEIAIVLPAGYRRGMIGARKLGMLSAGLIALLAVFIAVAGWQPIWRHFREPESARTRALLIQSTLHIARDRPVLGAGLGNWRTIYPAYALFDNGLAVREAHSDWAQWAAEGGAPFFILMLAIALSGVRDGWRSLWGIGVGMVFLHALADYPTREPALCALLFAMLGALAATRPSRNPAPPNSCNSAASWVLVHRRIRDPDERRTGCTSLHSSSSRGSGRPRS